MRIVRRIAFLALIFVIADTIFQNQGELGRTIDFHFLYWQKSLVLGFWIFLSFVAGGFVFLFLDTWRNIRLRWKLRSQEQQIAKLQADLNAAKPVANPAPASDSKL